DCYFIASLGEIAYKKPDLIQQMFTDNGDGTYTVRFFNNGVADYVTVDKYFAADGNGNFVYDNKRFKLSDTFNELWRPLAEKAYAQLAEEGWSRPTAANSYQAISNGWPDDVLAQITGHSAARVSLSSLFPVWVNGAVLDNAFNSGDLIVLNTLSSGVAS